ncbi:MAG: TIGR00341 family protein [Porphyromonadaceae bacterium]|nr:TIGR00341 family protein [Porphyromonadaceae bacterium]
MNNNETPEAKTPGLLTAFRQRLHYIFDLEGDKENERYTIEAIKEDVDFRGSKMWILVFAILIASLGLNVNSTAVIIGAMLVSPLMGPIIGFGLGLGIYDFELIKKSLRNLGLMTLISIATAALYFLISPLSQAQSELLARTQPTIYDVLIAFFGGAAGIVASSTRHKGNVIIGVAIATALMPPLCTAGYGLAQGNLSFFFGAFYLYLINSVFIGLSTLIMVRVLKFPYKTFVDPEREKRIRQFVIAISVCTIAPSVYFGWQLISQNMAEVGAHRFVQEQLSNPANQVIKEGLTMSRGKGQLEVVLLGRELEADYLDSVKMLMPSYGLQDVELVVRQGFGSKHADNMDMNQIKSVLLQDLYENSDKIIREQSRQIDSLQNQLRHYERYSTMLPDVQREARSLFSDIGRLSFAPEVREGMSSDSTLIVIVESGRLSSAEEAKLRIWLAQRTKVKEVRLLMPSRS